jgi:hypothetical protein
MEDTTLDKHCSNDNSKNCSEDRRESKDKYEDELICPYTEEELKDMERERLAGMCDAEAWEMYKEAEKRGFNPIEAINRWYSGDLQEWEIKI